MSAAAEEGSPAIVNGIEGEEIDVNIRAAQYLAKQTKPVIIPSFSRWFEMNTIHEIEKRSLPEFFISASKYKSPEIYKSVRDFIINCYRLNPIEYLSVTAVRRNIALDVGSLIRIYGFLSKWGLINYQIDPKTKSFSMKPQYTGHYQIVLDKPTSLELMIPNEVAQANEDSDKKIDIAADNNDSDAVAVAVAAADDSEPPLKKQKISGNKFNLALRKNIYNSAEDAFILNDSNRDLPVQTKRIYCSITGNDITTTRYHNLKSKTNISTDCFENGQFENYFKSSDFIKLERTILQGNDKPWSNSEILLLLEGLEMYGEDWNSIAGHVGSRTKEQCVGKFLQLPIEDSYINKQIKQGSLEKYLQSAKKTSGKGLELKEMLEKLIEKVTTTTTTTTTSTSTIIDVTPAKSAELESQITLLTQLHALLLEKFDIKLKTLTALEEKMQDSNKLLNHEREKLVTEKLLWKKHISKIQSTLATIVKSVDFSTAEKSSEVINQLTDISKELLNVPSVEVKILPSAETSLLEDATKEEKVDENVPISVVEPQVYVSWKA